MELNFNPPYFFLILLKSLSFGFKSTSFANPITASTLLHGEFGNFFFSFLMDFPEVCGVANPFLVTGAILVVSVTFFLSLHLLVFSLFYSLAAVSSSLFIEALSLF